MQANHSHRGMRLRYEEHRRTVQTVLRLIDGALTRDLPVDLAKADIALVMNELELLRTTKAGLKILLSVLKKGERRYSS